MEELTERHCNGCDTTKSIEEFCKDKYRTGGYSYRCKSCRNIASKNWALQNPEKVKEANDKNRTRRKEFYSSPKGILSSRRTHLKRKYNITLEEFDQKLSNQNYRCAICNGTDTHDKHSVFAVDHCHTTGKIRGLLCWKCNAGLGLFNDNKENLKNAINYLKKHD